jgi:phenylalanyl-tRNA synthetase alpha chain
MAAPPASGGAAASTADLDALARQFADQATAVERSGDRAAWEELRLAWLGRKQGRVRDLLGHLGELPPDERRAWGQGVNRLKETVEARLE